MEGVAGNLLMYAGLIIVPSFTFTLFMNYSFYIDFHHFHLVTYVGK